MTEAQRALHLQMLEQYEAQFDCETGLIQKQMISRGYHTNLKSGTVVHSIRDSLLYAVALLDGGAAGGLGRAKAIIQKVLSLQDTNEESRTFGLWSYHYEEPLAQMSPPDWNWADFMAKDLLYLLLYHAEQFEAEEIEQLKQAVERACASMIRRDQWVNYTNIVVMDIYCTIVAGEQFGNKAYFDYGREKLARLLAFTEISTNGETNEYNSPCYTLLAAEDIACLLRDVRDADTKRGAQRFSHLLWRCIGEHFHAPTQQWGAPQARCYDDFLTERTLYKLSLATGGAVKAPRPVVEADTFRTAAQCPSECLPYFTQTWSGSSRKLVKRGFCHPYFEPAVLASSYRTPDVTLGSFSRAEFWNQIRPLMAYFRVGEDVICMRVQVLHDGYDYSSASLHCVQQNGAVLGHIAFSTNRGDTHVSLDAISGRIFAEDLRIRLKFESRLGKQISLSEDGDGCKLSLGNQRVSFHVPFCAFGERTIQRETHTEAGLACYDVVLYHGQRTKLDFLQIDQAGAVFTLQIGEGGGDAPADVQRRAGYLRSRWTPYGQLLEVATRLKPDVFCCVAGDSYQGIGGLPAEECEAREERMLESVRHED